MAPTIDDDFLTNSAYGFPRGAKRRIAPKVLAVVHITANMGDAQAQRDYANRAGSNGPSAHFYIDRDGGGIRAIDPAKYAAWSNGDLKSPRLTNVGVKYLDDLRPTHNANEGCYLEIEGVGTATATGQWTDEQFDTVARLIADAAEDTGLAITTTTVLPHAYINTIDRAHCPSLNVGAHMTRLIALAKEKQTMSKQSFSYPENPSDPHYPHAGSLVINGPNHWYVSIADGELHGPINPAYFGTKRAFGPVTPVPAVPGHPGELCYLVGSMAALLLVKDVIFTADKVGDDCADEIGAAITADRAKAHIVYDA